MITLSLLLAMAVIAIGGSLAFDLFSQRIRNPYLHRCKSQPHGHYERYLAGCRCGLCVRVGASTEHTWARLRGSA